jgi:hypothetical protein
MTYMLELLESSKSPAIDRQSAGVPSNRKRDREDAAPYIEQYGNAR